MISNKTAVTLLFIISNMQLAASTVPEDIQGSSPSGKPALQMRKRRHASKPMKMLRDTNNGADPVKVQEGSTEGMDVSQGVVVHQVNRQFEELIEQGKYDEIFELGRKMRMTIDEFLEQLCPIVTTLERYNEIVGHLKSRKMAASFYMYGDIEVVKGAIIGSKTYECVNDYFPGGDLETALLMAFKEDDHDRVTNLLRVRKEITVEKDKLTKQLRGRGISFVNFVSSFLSELVPWGDTMVLKRFLTIHGNRLREKHPDIFDIFCEKVVYHLSYRLVYSQAKELLIDLVGQPSLLTPVLFAKGFLYHAFNDSDRSNFIKYGWREAIEEGLKDEYEEGGRHLWQVMKEAFPNPSLGEYSSTADARAAISKQFQTKEQLEWQWIKNNASDFLDTIEQVFAGILPTVLIRIIVRYVGPTWIDVLGTKSL